MFRRLLMLASLLSLLLCAAAVVLWWRSWHFGDAPDQITWLEKGGERYTMRSESGMVGRFVPPRGNAIALVGKGEPVFAYTRITADSPRQVWESDLRFELDPTGATAIPVTALEAAAALANDQPIWTHITSTDKPNETHDIAIWQPNTPVWMFENRRLNPNDAAVVLLPALEDPNRFAVAHLLLRSFFPLKPAKTGDFSFGAWRQTAGWNSTVDGLQIALKPPSADRIQRFDNGAAKYYDCPATFDPAQLPAIRAIWHRRLDVAEMLVPWWQIFALTLVLPAIWFALITAGVLRRRRRKRIGHCPACGYDLRFSSDRCPECGREQRTA